MREEVNCGHNAPSLVSGVFVLITSVSAHLLCMLGNSISLSSQTTIDDYR